MTETTSGMETYSLKLTGLVLIGLFANGCLPESPTSSHSHDDMQAQIDDLTQKLADAEERLSAIEVNHLTSSDLTGYATERWVTDQNYAAESDVATNTTDIEDLQTAQSAINTKVSNLPDSAPMLLEADTTYTIGSSGDYADLNEAFSELQPVTIPSGVTVTLQVEEDHTYTEPVLINHRDGANIHIVGDASGAASTLTFEGTDGILVAKGYGLGMLEGINIVGDGESSAYGVQVDDNGWAYLQNVEVSGFSRSGFEAIRGGLIRQHTAGPLIAEANYDGFHAFNGGIIYLSQGSSALANTHYGYYADYHGLIDATDTTSSENRFGSYHAHVNSTIGAARSSASDDPEGTCYYSTSGSTIIANDARATGCFNGFSAFNNGSIRASSTTCTDASSYCYSSLTNGFLFVPEATSRDALVGDARVSLAGVLYAPGLNDGNYSSNYAAVREETDGALFFD